MNFVYRITLTEVIAADTMEDAIDEFTDMHGLPDNGDIDAECIGEREIYE